MVCYLFISSKNSIIINYLQCHSCLFFRKNSENALYL